MDRRTALKQIAEQTGLRLTYDKIYQGWTGEDDNLKVVIWQDRGRWMQAVRIKQKSGSKTGQLIRDIVRQLNA